jgi:potassium channel subfamily K
LPIHFAPFILVKFAIQSSIQLISFVQASDTEGNFARAPLIANISLLLSFANRLPFSLSQVVTILSFFSSSITSIAGAALTKTNAWPYPQGSSLSASFYYACISARIRHEIPTDLSETLTLPQRTLMGQSLGFIMYLVSGAAIFSAIEGWRFTDGIYWATATLLTIGFGDIVPVTHTGRSLIIFYATAGIVMIGLVVGSIGTLVLDRGAKKMFARMTINAREKKLRAATREIQADVSSSQQKRLFIISTVAIFMLWFLGALVFWSMEKASQSWS